MGKKFIFNLHDQLYTFRTLSSAHHKHDAIEPWRRKEKLDLSSHPTRKVKDVDSNSEIIIIDTSSSSTRRLLRCALRWEMPTMRSNEKKEMEELLLFLSSSSLHVFVFISFLAGENTWHVVLFGLHTNHQQQKKNDDDRSSAAEQAGEEHSTGCVYQISY